MKVFVMLIYAWAGSTASMHTIEFSSAEACIAARASFLEAYAEAVTVDPVPQPNPIVLCVAK